MQIESIFKNKIQFQGSFIFCVEEACFGARFCKKFKKELNNGAK